MVYLGTTILVVCYCPELLAKELEEELIKLSKLTRNTLCEVETISVQHYSFNAPPTTILQN